MFEGKARRMVSGGRAGGGMSLFDVDAVVAAMTLEEKCACLTGEGYWELGGCPRLGIGPITVSDGPHGLRRQADTADNLGLAGSEPAVCFPTASAAACSFDADLVRTMGEALGDEARGQGVAVVLGPGANMKRSPLCGRNFEYFSEDPHLAGELAAAYIEGVQSRGVGTSLKHFACNNQETNRLIVDAVVDERALHELYLEPFRIAVEKARPWTVMTAYNLLDGAYCSENARLLALARDEWGFDGAYVSDWGAENDNKASLPSGLDLVMPGPRADYRADVAAAVQAGELSEERLDAAVRRILELHAKHAAAEGTSVVRSLDERLDVARAVAEGSAVLLENDGALPLVPGARVAVIGAFAREPRYQGAGSSKINPVSLDCAWDALAAAGAAASYAPGYDAATGEADEALLDEAARIAAAADVAVVFVGLPDASESEGADRVDMALPDLLLGRANPSGKLAETWPVRLADTPCAEHFPEKGRQARYRESVYTGYRYYDAAGADVAYPFGHGLSYTEFSYRDLQVGEAPDGGFSVSCLVRNDGPCAGREAVQLYVAPLEPGAFRPPQELKGFAKAALAPGEECRVTLPLPRRAFAHYDADMRAWDVEAGAYEVRIAASSRDVRLSARVEVAGSPRREDGAPEAYHRVRPGGFSDEAFRKLYGRALPKVVVPMRPYTANATVGDLKASLVGRLVHYLLRRELRLLLAGDAERRAQAELAVMETPLRTLAMSGTNMNLVGAAVDVLNYRFIRGFKKLRALKPVLAASAVLFVFLGVRLLLNRRKHAAATANTLAALTVLSIIGTLMLFGLSAHHIGYLVQLVILIAVTSYLDPSLAEERALQRKLRKMDKEQRREERRRAAEAKPKRGFITLNFFNLFWIFVVCCVLGLIIEVLFHFALYHEYQDRAGLLFGPFSPIYGFGALLMTIALNRFHDKPVWVIFLVSAVIGGAFEYFTSWIMEFSFGIRAWDYSGTFLSIDGRTNFVFMVMWGVLGVAWIKLLLPQLLKLINLIPWNWRYGVTAACAALMLLDGVMTVQSIDCWYQRMAGKAPDTPIEQFYAKHYDNDFMQNRFQTMTMNVADATRIGR